MDGNNTVDLNELLSSGNYLDQWLLMKTPFPVGLILTSYLVFILNVGPRFMSSREPYKCELFIRVYNALQVYYNSWMLYKILIYYNILPVLMRFNCSLEGSEHFEQEKYLFIFFAWHYLVLKLLDLLDTVFMVVKKKNSHISFLHVYHHASMVLLAWVLPKYFKSHHGVLPALINLSVHAIMYSYYLLATFSSMKKYLWWKVHLTKLQMSQFVIILLYFCFIYWNGCQMSKMLNYCLGFVVFTFLCLFINFYIKTYVQTPAKQEENIQKTKQN